MQYKWEVPAEEVNLNNACANGDIPVEEIGNFEVFTENPQKLKDGEGTTLVYIQGVQLKYGRDDNIGNSPLSWIEESILPSANESIIKTNLLPIGHVARRLNFDHFITFVFPHILTARGFDVAIRRLLTYLQPRNYTTVLTGWSNGATLTGEWLLNCILSNNQECLRKFFKSVEMVICAGGPCQTEDHERLALNAGKVGINRLLKLLYPIADKHPFIKRAGGVYDLVSRGKYLMNLDNISKANQITKINWVTSQKILEDYKDFKLIFLADLGQRVVLPQGPINWYNIFHPKIGNRVSGYIAKNVTDPWLKLPKAEHGEVRQLWTLVSLIGLSQTLRNKLAFSPLACEIADNWPKRRFTEMV